MKRLLTIVTAALSLAFASIHDAAIEGTVTDSTGKPVAGAVVQAHHKVRSATFQATTDQKGAYALTGIPPGTYSMFVKGKGFCAQWIPQVVAGSGERVRQDFTLNREKGCQPDPQGTDARRRYRGTLTPLR